MGRHRKPIPPLAPPPPQYLEALMGGSASLTGRRALILPVLPGLRPGLDVYEKAIFPLRCPEIDVYGLTVPFGPIPEDSLYVYGELLDFVIQDRAIVEDEGAIRTRAWLEEMAPQYDRIVLLSYMPATTLKPWSRAVAWSQGGNKTRIVKMTRGQRITDSTMVNQLRSALGLSKRDLDPLGMGLGMGGDLSDAAWDAGSAFGDMFDQPLAKNDDDLLDDDDGDLVGDDEEEVEEDQEDGDDGDDGDILDAIGRAVPRGTR